MSATAANVYIALQNNDDTRPIIDALTEANPHAVVSQLACVLGGRATQLHGFCQAEQLTIFGGDRW